MRVTKWSAALLCGIALMLPLPLVAQDDAIPKDAPPPEEEPKADAPEPVPAEATPAEPAPAEPAPKKANYGDPPLHRWGGWTIAVSAWEPSLVGADEEVAASFPGGVETPIMVGGEATIRETVAAIYHLPKNAGSIGVRYDSMHQSDFYENLTPGVFGFVETRAYPILTGAFDDGRADGVSANLDRKTREFRLDYFQTAFETPRAKGTWGVGYRDVSHSRDVEISYLALVPNLPPIIPPVGTIDDAFRLQPRPDQVTQIASFTGHGLGVSLDLQFPVAPRVSIVSGLALGLIRGSETSTYTSLGWYYFLVGDPSVPLTKDQLFTILSDPCEGDECGPPPGGGGGFGISDVEQGVIFAAWNQPSTSQFAETLDIYLGVEVAVWRGLKLFGTLRDTYYANVGEYVVPRPGLTTENTSLSAGYEGYTFGLSWRF